MKTLLKKWQRLLTSYRQHASRRLPIGYRVVEIERQEGQYKATIQVVGKNVVFNAKPAEILADDKMTAQFSTIDVRNLTYLGYEDIHQPQYKIVAKQQDDNNNTVFAVHKRGEKNITIKTAAQLVTDTGILKAIDQEDALMIGFTAGTEQVIHENLAKAAARKTLTESIKPLHTD